MKSCATWTNYTRRCAQYLIAVCGSRGHTCCRSRVWFLRASFAFVETSEEQSKCKSTCQRSSSKAANNKCSLIDNSRWTMVLSSSTASIALWFSYSNFSRIMSPLKMTRSRWTSEQKSHLKSRLVDRPSGSWLLNKGLHFTDLDRQPCLIRPFWSRKFY